VSSRLEQAANRVKLLGEATAERFARGIFPDPRNLFDVQPEEGEVFWYNKPELGVMTGLLFLDGSGKLMGLTGLARAGWAIMACDNLGNVKHAAYGPVPVSAWPLQTCKDGEDYVVYMMKFLGMPPFQLYIDCQSTRDCLAKGPGFSTGPGASRAHLWEPFWAAFQPEDLEVFKTMAHASGQDVLSGRTSAWEKKGNDAADEFAKAGADKHGVRAEHANLYRGLRCLAREAGRWAGTLEVHLAGRGARDTAGLPDQAAREARGGDPPADAEQAIEEDGRGGADGGELGGWEEHSMSVFRLHGHVFVCAPVATASGEAKGKLVFCCRCGAVSGSSVPTRALGTACRGPKSGTGAWPTSSVGFACISFRPRSWARRTWSLGPSGARPSPSGRNLLKRWSAAGALRKPKVLPR